MSDDLWPAVGAAVRARREALGLTQVELARAAGVSDTLVRVLETARREKYRRGNLRAIAQALSWPDDAIDKIRSGRPPDEALAEADGRTIEERLAALEGEVAELKQAFYGGDVDLSDPDEAAVWALTTYTADERRAAIRAIREARELSRAAELDAEAYRS